MGPAARAEAIRAACHRPLPVSFPIALGRGLNPLVSPLDSALRGCPHSSWGHHHQAGAERVWLAQHHQTSWFLVNPAVPRCMSVTSCPDLTFLSLCGAPQKGLWGGQSQASRDGFVSKTWPSTCQPCKGLRPWWPTSTPQATSHHTEKLWRHCHICILRTILPCGAPSLWPAHLQALP